MARVPTHSRAPGFCLPDYNGRPVSLADFSPQNNVLLVFNRSLL